MNDNLKCPLFLLDSSFMKNILEGRALSNKAFERMITLKNNNVPFIAATNFSSFQRAIYLCDFNIPAKNIKFIMELVKIHFSNADYRNEKEVRTEFVKFTKLMSEGAL